MRFALLIMLMIGTAQAATINVTDHGVVGDTATVYVNVTTNSATVVTTNEVTAGDIGKVVQLFRGGYFAVLCNDGQGGVTPTNAFNCSYGSTATNHQDIVATIIDVPTANSIVLDVACGVTASDLRMTYGTENRAALSNIIATVHTDNDVIYFPIGNYQILPSEALDTNYVQSSIFSSPTAITLYKSRITFLGDGTNDSILTGCGAWQQKGADVACRGSLFRISSVTNNGSMIFESLQFDGNKDYIRGSRTSWPATPTDGSGWDTTHHVWTDIISSGDDVTLPVFTNCLFQRWAGETIQPIGTGINSELVVDSNTFNDGNSTVINANGKHRFWNNYITNYYQVGESGQFVANTNGPSTYYNNVSVSIYGGAHYAFTGASTNVQHDGYIISNNIASVTSPNHWILANAAKNMVVVSNVTGGTLVIGSAGQQTLGGGFNTNWLIRANNWTNGQVGVSFAGTGLNRAESVIIESNTFAVSIYSVNYSSGTGAWSTNVTLRYNVGNKRTDSTSAGGEYPKDELSNNFPFLATTDAVGITNNLYYSQGARHSLTTIHANSRYSIVATNPIPAGAQLVVTNATAATIATFLSPAMTLSGSSAITNYWNDVAGTWSTNPVYRILRAGNIRVTQ